MVKPRYKLCIYTAGRNLPVLAIPFQRLADAQAHDPLPRMRRVILAVTPKAGKNWKWTPSVDGWAVEKFDPHAGQRELW
jgi:hypothetical protein